VVTTSHPAPYTRTVAVYVPAQYVPGTIAPFIVGADGPDQIRPRRPSSPRCQRTAVSSAVKQGIVIRRGTPVNRPAQRLGAV
jgi:hypothetical protein